MYFCSHTRTHKNTHRFAQTERYSNIDEWIVNVWWEVGMNMQRTVPIFFAIVCQKCVTVFIYANLCLHFLDLVKAIVT